jgi:hypothetical protein
MSANKGEVNRDVATNLWSIFELLRQGVLTLSMSTY